MSREQQLAVVSVFERLQQSTVVGWTIVLEDEACFSVNDFVDKLLEQGHEKEADW
jgi:hypothetical protein